MTKDVAESQLDESEPLLTNTTSTAAYLYAVRSVHQCVSRGVLLRNPSRVPEDNTPSGTLDTHAAAAPKISARLAFLIKLRITVKDAVNTTTMVSLATALWRKCRPRIGPRSNNVPHMTVSVVTIFVIADSSNRP